MQILRTIILILLFYNNCIAMRLRGEGFNAEKTMMLSCAVSNKLRLPLTEQLAQIKRLLEHKADPNGCWENYKHILTFIDEDSPELVYVQLLVTMELANLH